MCMFVPAIYKRMVLNSCYCLGKAQRAVRSLWMCVWWLWCMCGVRVCACLCVWCMCGVCLYVRVWAEGCCACLRVVWFVCVVYVWCMCGVCVCVYLAYQIVFCSYVKSGLLHLSDQQTTLPGYELRGERLPKLLFWETPYSNILLPWESFCFGKHHISNPGVKTRSELRYLLNLNMSPQTFHKQIQPTIKVITHI